MYYVLDLADYYLYSGDMAFAESQYPVDEEPDGLRPRLVDPDDGPDDRERPRLGLLRRRQAGAARGHGHQRDSTTRRWSTPRWSPRNSRRAIRATRTPRPGRPTRRPGRARPRTSRARSTRTCSTPRGASTSCRPRQRHPRRDLGAAGRQRRGDHLRGRARERRTRDPELPQEQPVGHVRPAAVLARRELLDGHQPVRHRHGGRRALRAPATPAAPSR